MKPLTCDSNSSLTWPTDDDADIAAKIEKGYASAEREELLDAEQVRIQVDERKQAWRDNNQR